MRDSGKILGFLSYVAVAAVGIAMFIAALISKNTKAVDILTKIAYYSALASIVLGSFFFCCWQKKIVFWIVWIVIVTLLVLGVFVL